MDPDRYSIFPERLDPVCPVRLDPDHVNIRPNPKPWNLNNKIKSPLTFVFLGVLISESSILGLPAVVRDAAAADALDAAAEALDAAAVDFEAVELTAAGLDDRTGVEVEEDPLKTSFWQGSDTEQNINLRWSQKHEKIGKK